MAIDLDQHAMGARLHRRVDLFINHVGPSIQVDNVLADLNGDFDWAVHSGLKTRGQPAMPSPYLKPDLELTAPCAGYLQFID